MAVSDVIRRMVKACGETPFRINNGNCDYFAYDLAETLKAMGVNLCNSCLISAFSFPNFSFCIVPVPSLADWEKDWQEDPQRSVHPQLPPADFRLPLVAIA